MVKIILETRRVILRAWKESDAENLYKYASDPDIGPIAGWPPHKNLDDSKNIIKNTLTRDKTYAICLKSDNKAIGSISLKMGNNTDMTDKDDECELGYWLGKKYSNNNFDDEEKELDKSKLEEIENNIISQMQEAISLVKTGQITYAASDTEIDNIKITQGDFLGTIEGDVVLCEKNLETAVISLIDLLIKNNNDAEILTLYYGEDITQDQTNNILDYVNKTYPDLETEIHSGNQPLYFYIISLE